MSQRLDDFLRELPARGVPDHAVTLYRTVLEELEAFLGKAAALRFSKYEINRFVAARQRAGASERELKNITTACTA
jgi:site-specific recombinase XerC